MNNKLIKIVVGSLIVGLPIFATVDAKANDHADMSHGEMEMKQDGGVYISEESETSMDMK